LRIADHMLVCRAAGKRFARNIFVDHYGHRKSPRCMIGCVDLNMGAHSAMSKPDQIVEIGVKGFPEPGYAG
jgi:hypothetical protein